MKFIADYKLLDIFEKRFRKLVYHLIFPNKIPIFNH